MIWGEKHAIDVTEKTNRRRRKKRKGGGRKKERRASKMSKRKVTTMRKVNIRIVKKEIIATK